ncbi:MAG: PAS domain S-box protein, partial [Nitrospirales bacterium]
MLTIILAVTLAMAVGGMLLLWRNNRRTERRLSILNTELIAASGDASVGRRLPAGGDGEIARLADTINRLFDALGERDEEIQDRDKLFMDFARTLPEIVLVHDERILLANDSAAALIGVSADQLEGRDVADLVKPAYRALFRKSMTKRLAGE